MAKSKKTYTLEIGNMKKKLAPLKIKPKSKKQAEADRKRSKLNHIKINRTRVAASLTAGKIGPCKK